LVTKTADHIHKHPPYANAHNKIWHEIALLVLVYVESSIADTVLLCPSEVERNGIHSTFYNEIGNGEKTKYDMFRGSGK